MKRGSFNATRQKGSGRGFHITLMKKKSEWLYGQRCRIRDRLASVNSSLKELRMARNGKPSESFAMTFLRITKDHIEEDTFNELYGMACEECPSQEGAYEARDGDRSKSVLSILKEEMEHFENGCSPKLRGEQRLPCPRERDSQEDFGLCPIEERDMVTA